MLLTPKLVFEAADLIAVLCTKEKGGAKSEVVKTIIDAFRAAGDHVRNTQDNAEDAEMETKLKHISHLLCILSAAVLSNKDPDRGMRLTTQIYESGIVFIHLNAIRPAKACIIFMIAWSSGLHLLDLISTIPHSYLRGPANFLAQIVSQFFLWVFTTCVRFFGWYNIIDDSADYITS